MAFVIIVDMSQALIRWRERGVRMTLRWRRGVFSLIVVLGRSHGKRERGWRFSSSFFILSWPGEGRSVAVYWSASKDIHCMMHCLGVSAYNEAALHHCISAKSLGFYAETKWFLLPDCLLMKGKERKGKERN
jgi:hypothetical protein